MSIFDPVYEAFHEAGIVVAWTGYPPRPTLTTLLAGTEFADWLDDDTPFRRDEPGPDAMRIGAIADQELAEWQQILHPPSRETNR